jgi:ABC-type antimicrobial peptide transport system permease subunit
MPGAPASLRFVVRGAGQATALAQPVRQAVRELEKDAVLHRVSTMERWVSDSTAGQRFSSLALGIFTGVAMLLAAAGLFGLMSYVVTQRRHEIGVRLALGAPASSVLRLVVRQGVALALIGTAAGIPLTIWAARLAAAQLYATSPADPAAIGGAALALAAVALLASLGPAWRAARTDCVAALRAD